MLIVRPDEFIIKLLACHLTYVNHNNSWKGLVVDHEGRDWMCPITDTDRLATVYILMRRFKRRCYESRFNVSIALGMSYKLTPAKALSLPKSHLMRMMRQHSMRSRYHYYSRFELAGVDPRDYRWPQYLSHNYVFPQDHTNVNPFIVTALHADIVGWLRYNMA